jgi:hypothetical protein
MSTRHLLLILAFGAWVLIGVPVRAATAFVQGKAGNGSGATTTLAITFDSNVTNGNCIVGFGADYIDARSLSSVSDTRSTMYTLKDNPTTYMNVTMSGTFYGCLTSGGANTVTLTFSGNITEGACGAVHEVSGVDTGTPFDVNKAAGGEAGGTDAVSTGAVTTTANGDYIFVGAGIIAETLTPGTNYTGRTTDSVQTVHCRTEDQIQAAAGSIVGTFTPSGAAYWAVGLLALRESGGGGPGPSFPSLLE